MRNTVVSTLFIVLMVAIGLLIGCQPTPEDIVVQSKNSPTNNQIQENNNEDMFSNIDSLWKENIEKSDDFIINIDAYIDLPKCITFNIYEIQRSYFDNDDIGTIIEVFMGNDYKIDGNKWTKSQLTELLIYYKGSYQSGGDGDISLEEYEANVADLERRIAEAPETIVEMDTEEYLNTFNERGYAYLSKDKGNEISATLKIVNNEMNTKVVFNDNSGDNFIAINSSAENLNLGITKEDAITIADSLIENLNLDFMELSTIVAGASYGEESNKMILEPKCFLLCYTRVLDGIEVNYDYRDGLTMLDADQLSKPLAYENIIIAVDAEGIRTFEWNGYLDEKHISTLYEDVSLLPFDTVKDNFLKNLYINYVPTDANYKVICEISNIKLGLMRVKTKDQFDQFKLTPVWDFYGNVKMIDENGNENLYYQCSDISSILTINAIDGTVINRELGY